MPHELAGPKTGLPAELLSRRPDIIAGKHLIESALQAQEAATKQWLPTLSFSATASLRHEEFKDLLDADNLGWNFGLQFSRVVLDGNKIKGDVTVARARLEEHVVSYQALVVAAFGEVQLALMQEVELKKQLTQLRSSLANSFFLARKERLSWLAGTGSFVNFREAEIAHVNLQSQLEDLLLNYLNNRLELYLALGGDLKPLP